LGSSCKTLGRERALERWDGLGASEDTLREISAEKYLKTVISNPKMRFFSSEEHGEITGFAVNRVQDDSTMELAGIIVREDLLSQRIGSFRLSKCVEFARETGFTNMVVKIEMSNERALNFYVKKGFVQVGDTVETVEDSKVELATLKLAL
jgi:ribosomal protein S18 acetylase RimI-like enzyme